MINTFSAWIAGKLLKNNAISADDLEVQIYGITAIICTALNYLILLALAIFFHRFVEAIIFLIFYMSLRNFIGEWHASSPLKCTVIGTILLFTYMLIAEFLPAKILTGLLLGGVALILIFMYAPSYMDKDYTPEEIASFKHKSRIIALIMLLIIVTSSFLTFWEYRITFQVYAGMGMFSAVLTMLPVRFKNLKC